MAASIQTTVNFTATFPTSHAVSLFRNLPRWPNAESSFSLSWSYLRTNALTALIPIITAILLTLLFSFLVTLRYTCLQAKVDERIRAPHSAPRQIAISLVLSVSPIIFIAIALSSITSIHSSADDALDVLTAVIADISRTGLAVVGVAMDMQQRLLEFNPTVVSPSVITPSVGDFLQPLSLAISDYMKTNFPNVSALDIALNDLVDQIRQGLSVIRKAVDITFGVLAAIIVMLLSGPLLLAFEDALPVSTRSRPCRIIGHVLFLLIPALMAWVLVGLSSSVGTVVGDMCILVHEYREVIAGTLTVDDVPNNALVNSSFLCTNSVNGTKIAEQFDATVASLLRSDLAKSTVELVLNTSASSIAETATWTKEHVLPYANCSRVQTFLGQIEFVTCAADGHSAIQSVFDLWICLLGLAIMMSAALLASLLGVRVAWGLLVWPTGKKESLEIGRGQRVDLKQVDLKQVDLKQVDVQESR